MRISGDTFFDTDGVDRGAAGALTNTQQLLLPIQSPNQSNLLPSALQSVLPLAFYTSPYQCACCFLLFAGRLQVQPRCFISLILDEGSHRYMNYSLPLDRSSSFSKMKVFRVFFLSVSGSSLPPNKKRTLSCDRCAFWVVRNRLTAWFRMHTYGMENYIELRSVS